MNGARVMVERVGGYDVDQIYRALPDSIFDTVQPGDRVVLKPNWVTHAHAERPDEWEHVITHPTVITAVLRKVLERVGAGQVTILDGPSTDASFARLMERNPTAHWRALASSAGAQFDIIDLRDCEWDVRHEIVVGRRRLPGDPRGKTIVDLIGDASEFYRHRRSSRGYYGADYDRRETNRAHDGHHNLYSVSRTVLEADVIVNLPKLKTHRKAGITACLKNLVGINTNKNYLPHHTEGGPHDGGDQFPSDTLGARIEGPMVSFVKQRLLRAPAVARALSPLRTLGKHVFGATDQVVRSGNWHGNDTLWRMILDLNKIMFHANPDGTMRDDVRAAKRFIGVVDAVVAGEGLGPLAPDPVALGRLVCGTNPVAIDVICADLMGFDAAKIPSIARAFDVRRYPLCGFARDELRVELAGAEVPLGTSQAAACKPHFGWRGNIEREPVDVGPR